MGYPVSQGQSAQPLVFFLASSTDHLSGVTGATPTVALSKNGAAFGAPGGAISEIGNGWYKVAGNATDSNTLGPLLLHATATGADPTDDCFPVVAYSPQDAARLGLTALPANAIGSGAGAFNLDASGNIKSAPQTAVTVGTLNNNVITASSIAASALNGKGDWLLASSYAAPPSAASIATTIWTDLTAGSDFATANSVGALVKANLDAAVSSRLATSGYTAPPTTAQIATAVLTDATAGDQSTAGSLGYIIAHAPSWYTSPPSTVTVSGYSAGQDPATLVLNATATSYNTAGTIGQKINAAGGASDPLTNAVPGSYAAGTAGYVLGTYLDAKVSSRLASSSYLAPDNTDIAAIKAQTDKLTFDASNYVKSSPQTAVTVSGTVAANVTEWAGVAAGGMPYSGTPPTTAQIATAVMSDVTDTVGADVVAIRAKTDQLTFTVANHVDATASLGGNVTVGGYAAGQDPATLILDVAAAAHNNLGTIGQKINSSGASGDPLSNQVPGSYASGTAGYALGHVGTVQVVTSSIVAQNGSFDVIQGDSYYATDGRAIQWTDGSGTWPNLTGATLQITVYGLTTWTHAVEVVTPGATYQTIQLELSSSDSQGMPSGRFKVTATLANGHTATLIDSTCTAGAA